MRNLLLLWTFFLCFMDGPAISGSASVSHNQIPKELHDAKHGVIMGVLNNMCDNGTFNLEMDWDGSAVNHTCLLQTPLPVSKDIQSVMTCDNVPPNYWPPHFCMHTPIDYDSLIPTFEGHRPLWPIFGEYKFVPPQRWLHNIEHGAVVLLYHPCADDSELMKLKNLVKSCLWKHIITPWNKLPLEKPFALVSWGCRLQMTFADLDAARSFIRSKAYKSPEAHNMKQGQYHVGLIEASEQPYDPEMDTVLC